MSTAQKHSRVGRPSRNTASESVAGQVTGGEKIGRTPGSDVDETDESDKPSELPHCL